MNSNQFDEFQNKYLLEWILYEQFIAHLIDYIDLDYEDKMEDLYGELDE